MEHGQLGHFLVYHLLPVLLIYGAMLALVGVLLYFYKKKKGGSKQSENKPEKFEILWAVKTRKKRRKKR
jgi:hypothetical protein